MTRFWIRSTLTDEQLGNFSLSLSHIQVVVIKGPSFFCITASPTSSDSEMLLAKALSIKHAKGKAI